MTKNTSIKHSWKSSLMQKMRRALKNVVLMIYMALE